MCVSIYYGGASGYEERDALLEYVRTIDPAQYTVLVTQFANRREIRRFRYLFTRQHENGKQRSKPLLSLFYPAKMRRYSDDLQKKMRKIKNTQKNQYMLTMDKTKP